jgi:hypothetical protein
MPIIECRMVEKETIMTVNELIETLKNYPGDTRVLTLGYEGGLDDIDMKWDSVVFDANSEKPSYIGKHEYVSMMDNNVNGTECVIIGRGK